VAVEVASLEFNWVCAELVKSIYPKVVDEIEFILFTIQSVVLLINACLFVNKVVRLLDISRY
jgi:hypothetical protein